MTMARCITSLIVIIYSFFGEVYSLEGYFKTSSSPLRILLLVEPTPFTYISGYSNRFKEMLIHMKQAGNEVHVLTPDDSANPPSDFLGFPITTLHGFRFSLYNHICLSVDLHGKTGETIRSFAPDVIHVSSPGFLVFPAIYNARKYNLPLVMSYHTHLALYAKEYVKLPGIQLFAEFLIRTVHGRADLTLVTSPQLHSHLNSLGVGNVDVWQKGINTERFSPSFRNEQLRQHLLHGMSVHPSDPQPMTMLYVGRLGVEKNLLALQQVLRTVPASRLILVGTGPYEQELKNLLREEDVIFLGVKEDDELSELFASCDVFVMPSETETLGFVVMEALASGLPVVGVAAGGLLDIISHGETGFLAPPGDVSMTNFSAYVMLLRSNSTIRDKLAMKGREWAMQWSWKVATDKLMEVQYPAAIAIHQTNQGGGKYSPLPDKDVLHSEDLL